MFYSWSFSGTLSSADFALFARKFAILNLRNFLFHSFPNSPVFSRRYSGSDLALSPVPHRSESVWLWLTTVALEQPPAKSAMLTLIEPPGRKGHQRHRSAQQLLNFGEHGEKWNSGKNQKKQEQTILQIFPANTVKTKGLCWSGLFRKNLKFWNSRTFLNRPVSVSVEFFWNYISLYKFSGKW